MYGASVVIEIYHHCEQYVKFVTTYVVVATAVVFDKTSYSIYYTTNINKIANYILTK